MIKMLSARITDPYFYKSYQHYQIKGRSNQQHLVGRILLANLLKSPLDRVLFDNNKDSLIGYKEYNQPYLLNSTYFFSIAHSYDRVIVGLSDQPIGIDIEYKRYINYTNLHRAFNTNELNWLKSLPIEAQVEQVLKLWTIKEAVLKLLGKGINGNLKSVQVKSLDSASLDSAIVERYNKKFLVKDLQLSDKYVGTLATELKQIF